MSEVETSKLPVGRRARAAFVKQLETGDDRVERHYLELKTSFDLNNKADRRKVVKFILGAAHRDPVKASRHFDGYAVMVLGLPFEGVRGLRKFEVMDLEQDMATFAGADPPHWDIDYVPAGDGRDFVLIIVDPPTGRVWPVLKTSDTLVSGDVYMRADGATRPATGPELVALIARTQASAQGRTLDLGVEPVGLATALRIDSDRLRELIRWHVERLEDQADDAKPHAAFAASMTLERRSMTDFREQVDDWAANALESPSSGVHELAAQMTRPLALRVTNNTTASLKEVRLELTFDVPLVALYWQKKSSRVRLFPDRPMDWGKDSFLTSVGASEIRPLITPEMFDSSIRIATEEPAVLVMEMRRLHAEQSVTTPDDDVVLVFFAEQEDPAPEKVTASWSLAAGDIDEVLRGTFDLEVEVSDWRGPLDSVIVQKIGRKGAPEAK